MCQGRVLSGRSDVSLPHAKRPRRVRLNRVKNLAFPMQQLRSAEILRFAQDDVRSGKILQSLLSLSRRLFILNRVENDLAEGQCER